MSQLKPERRPLWQSGFGILAHGFAADSTLGVRPADVTEWARAAHAWFVMRGEQELPAHLKAVRIPKKQRPLYLPDPAEESWIFNGADYTSQQAEKWVWEEVRRCCSLEYWATHYAYTKNERMEYIGTDDDKPPGADLIPDWPYIRAVFRALDPPGRDTIIEKSRDMLMSWLCMACVAHDLIFRRNWPVMTLSRIESLVDDGGENCTVDTLHGKVRYIYEHLPDFLRDAVELKFKFLTISSPTTKSHAKGFSATIHAGRGPKWRRAIFDEAAWAENSEQVMTSMTPACPYGKVLPSTPHGKANAFFRIAKRAQQVWPVPKTWDGEPSRRRWQKLTVHWSQHPLRDQQWKDDFVSANSMTPEAVAQELEISYEKSLEGRVYPKFVYDVNVAGETRSPVEVAGYDQLRALVLAMDFNYDPLIWEVLQVYPEGPGCYRFFDELCLRNSVISDACRTLFLRYGSRERVEAKLAEFPDWEADYGHGGMLLAGDAGHRGQIIIYGDSTEQKSTVHNRIQTYKDIKAQLEELGNWEVVLKVPPANPPRIRRFEVTNDALQKALVVVHPRCEQLIRDFESAVWNTSRTDVEQHKEDDDNTGLTRSHASSAAGYFLCRVHRTNTSDTAKQRGVANRVGVREQLRNVGMMSRFLGKV